MIRGIAAIGVRKAVQRDTEQVLNTDYDHRETAGLRTSLSLSFAIVPVIVT